jgi:LPXTG-motif cell wall-anchored protein
MKANFLIVLFYCFPALLFSQEFKLYNIDDSIQVSLPADFKKLDTLGQTQITARTSFGFIQISKQPDNNHSTPDIEKVKHLNRYYNDFIKRISASSKQGTISNEKDTLLGNLRVKDFTLALDSGSGKQYRNFRILHENSATYTFQYLYQDIHSQYAAPESESFFKSITLTKPATLKSQFTVDGTTTGKAPASNSKLYMIVGAAVLIMLGIIVFLRKRKAR